MGIIEKFIEKARESPKKIVLPEGEDERILSAARTAVDEGIALPIILGDQVKIHQVASSLGIGLDGIFIDNPTSSHHLVPYSRLYAKMREFPELAAQRIVIKPIYFGAMMINTGDADGMVAGAVYASEEIVMAANLIIGLAEGVTTPSTISLLDIPNYSGGEDGAIIFADCAMNVNPTPQELADIVLTSAKSAEVLCGWEPRVAMLSFSTKGSAVHPDIEKVVKALEIVKSKVPRFAVDGELQVDSALVPDIANKKIKGESPVAGKANVLIFPDLDAANIGYKLSKILTGAVAYGPIMQGWAKPLSDLSRGATVEDILGAIALVGAQITK